MLRAMDAVLWDNQDGATHTLSIKGIPMVIDDLDFVAMTLWLTALRLGCGLGQGETIGLA